MACSACLVACVCVPPVPCAGRMILVSHYRVCNLHGSGGFAFCNARVAYCDNAGWSIKCSKHRANMQALRVKPLSNAPVGRNPHFARHATQYCNAFDPPCHNGKTQRSRNSLACMRLRDSGRSVMPWHGACTTYQCRRNRPSLSEWRDARGSRDGQASHQTAPVARECESTLTQPVPRQHAQERTTHKRAQRSVIHSFGIVHGWSAMREACT